MAIQSKTPANIRETNRSGVVQSERGKTYQTHDCKQKPMSESELKRVTMYPAVAATPAAPTLPVAAAAGCGRPVPGYAANSKASSVQLDLSASSRA